MQLPARTLTRRMKHKWYFSDNILPIQFSLSTKHNFLYPYFRMLYFSEFLYSLLALPKVLMRKMQTCVTEYHTFSTYVVFPDDQVNILRWNVWSTKNCRHCIDNFHSLSIFFVILFVFVLLGMPLSQQKNNSKNQQCSLIRFVYISLLYKPLRIFSPTS